MLNNTEELPGRGRSGCDPGVGHAVTHLCLLDDLEDAQQAAAKSSRRAGTTCTASAREILRGAPQDRGKDGAQGREGRGERCWYGRTLLYRYFPVRGFPSRPARRGPVPAGGGGWF